MMNYQDHKAAMAALESGTATPDQQSILHKHILNMRRQHNAELREAERDARDAYHGGRSDAAAEARGEPYGTW